MVDTDDAALWRFISSIQPSELEMLRRAPDFHYALSCSDHVQRFAQLSLQHPVNISSARVSTGEQNYARRRAQSYDQVGEVTIFRNERRRGHASRSKDIAIFSAGETQVPNLNAGLAKLVPNPTRQRRGEMIIEPNRHSAAIIG